MQTASVSGRTLARSPRHRAEGIPDRHRSSGAPCRIRSPERLHRSRAGRTPSRKARGILRTEGVDDPILVEIPKGSYALTFHLRPVQVQRLPHCPRAWFEPPRKKSKSALVKSRLGHRRGGAFGAAGCFVITSADPAFAADRVSNAVAEHATPAAYQIFLESLRHQPAAALGHFQQWQLRRAPGDGHALLQSDSDQRTFILDHYTGVGEVLAIHQLDRVFDLLNRPLRVKRGALFSLDDAKNNDLIFVGSPSENLTLARYPRNRGIRLPAPRLRPAQRRSRRPECSSPAGRT